MDNRNKRHPIEQILDGEQEAISKFASERPDLWQVTSACANTAEMLLATAANINNLSEAEGWRLLLWQTALRYQFLSLRFIITRDLDSAYTLLRNATELARDVASIKDNTRQAKLWLESKVANKRDYSFKFDETDPMQSYVFRLYKMASDWGTHGHYSVLMFREVAGRTGKNDALALLKVSQAGTEEALSVWLAGFCPIQWVCAEQFVKTHPTEFAWSWAKFVDFGHLIEAFLKKWEEVTEETLQDSG